MKKFLNQLICTILISCYFLNAEQVQSLVPYYYFPTIKNLQKESTSIANNAYQKVRKYLKVSNFYLKNYP